MLPNPNELSGIDPNVRRFNSQLQKEFALQALRRKHTQTIRLRPISYGGLTNWMHSICTEKLYRQYIIDCVNEQMEGSGWLITGNIVEKNHNGQPWALNVVLKYRVERDKGLDLETSAA